MELLEPNCCRLNYSESTLWPWRILIISSPSHPSPSLRPLVWGDGTEKKSRAPFAGAYVCLIVLLEVHFYLQQSFVDKQSAQHNERTNVRCSHVPVESTSAHTGGNPPRIPERSHFFKKALPIFREHQALNSEQSRCFLGAHHDALFLDSHQVQLAPRSNLATGVAVELGSRTQTSSWLAAFYS